MSVVVVVTAFPIPEHQAEVVAAFEAAIDQVYDEPGVELDALHEGPDRLVVIEEYGWEQARSDHAKGAALADLRSALAGKLSSGLGAQVLVPTRPETPRRARCDRTPVTHQRKARRTATIALRETIFEAGGRCRPSGLTVAVCHTPCGCVPL